MSGTEEVQLAFKWSLKLDTVGTSAICGGSLLHGPVERTKKSRFSPGKMKTWSTDLEAVPSAITCSWRFKEFRRRAGCLFHGSTKRTEPFCLCGWQFVCAHVSDLQTVRIWPPDAVVCQWQTSLLASCVCFDVVFVNNFLHSKFHIGKTHIWVAFALGIILYRSDCERRRPSLHGLRFGQCAPLGVPFVVPVLATIHGGYVKWDQYIFLPGRSFRTQKEGYTWL